MENATKALLIAAAVLIAIVLVALGVNLLSSVGDTTDQAEQVGSAIGEGVGNSSDKVIGSLTRTMTFSQAKVILQQKDGMNESLLNYYETIYGDFSYRVYKNDSNVAFDTIHSSEKLWNDSEVIKELPLGYYVQGTRIDSTYKRFTIVIAPES